MSGGARPAAAVAATIALDGIVHEVGGFRLDRISFAVAAGEYAVLMGPTGAGKTTLLEIICGLRRQRAGRVLLRGVDVGDWSPADRGVGYVPQDLGLFPTLTVRGHLEFALRIRRTPAEAIRRRTGELAGMLGIIPLLDRGLTGLSGGERQRVALGRALAHRPPVLLLDEPLSAVDPATRRDLHEVLRAVQRTTGTTTLHVTHNLEDAAALADRLLLLEPTGVVEAAVPRPGDHGRAAAVLHADRPWYNPDGGSA